MTAPQFFLGRQPIVGRQGELLAYELLFRSSTENAATVVDDVSATAAVLQYAFSDLGLNAVLQDKIGFINLSEGLLRSDIIEALPREQVMLEILETVELTPAVLARCQQLKDLGYHLALDDVIGLDAAQEAILPLLDVVKLDVLGMSREEMTAVVARLKPYPLQILAEKVDSPEQRDFCKDLGCELFQGYFFARPTILSGRPIQPSAMLLLKLLSQVAAEAEIEELEETLKRAPDLTIRLLKQVNSPAAGLGRKVSSVRAAITILGRKQLHRWVQIMVFAQQAGSQGGNDPLVQTAAVRGRVMEGLANALQPGNTLIRDRAFMVGMLSLMDALFGQPLAEILLPLNLEDSMQQALLERSGELGRLLQIAENLELADPAQDAWLTEQLGSLALADLNRLQFEAMSWAAKLGKE